MRKKVLTMVCAAVLAASMTMPAFAGQWLSDASGWWWKNDDGSWPANCWMWLDGNGDGVAECYYFNGGGYCLMNTTTPDGYQVNENGAWVVNGVVQTKSVTPVNPQDTAPVQTVTDEGSQTASAQAVKLVDMTPVAKDFMWTFNSERTNQDKQWSDGIKLDSSRVYEAYAEYYAGGAYSTLSFTYAPIIGFSENIDAWIEVYGDDDELLYYKSSPETVSVNVTGQQYVKIMACSNYNHQSIVGLPKGSILFKNAEFR